MHLRERLQKLIDSKQQEINDLQTDIEKAKAYIQALQDSMRFLPKNNGDEDASLRPGTALAQARDVLQKAGKPMHISELLKALGKPVDKKNRLSLSGSLSTYVRNGQIFTRPAPNTFGLMEQNKGSEVYDDDVEIPEDFGAEK